MGALTLAGCGAGTGTAEPTASPEVAEPAGSTTTTDEITCAGFGDVLTITANADAGLRDGRMAEQEQQGWYRLATRILDGVPTRGEGAVTEVIGALKAAAPAVNLGAVAATGIGSPEWNQGLDDLSMACTEAGTELAVQMFTGG